MKKIVSVLVLAFVFTFTAQAQREQKKEAYRKMTSEQKATLRVKKMALKLDLTANQQRQVKAVLKKVIEERMARKENNEKVKADKTFQKHNARLDKQLAFKQKMKKILNEKQYEKFDKMIDRKMMKMKKMKKKKMIKHKRKHHTMKKN